MTQQVVEAALRIAENETPWVGWDSTYCRHCGRDLVFPRGVPESIEYVDRRQHEPDCSWIALRDALGLDSK